MYRCVLCVLVCLFREQQKPKEYTLLFCGKKRLGIFVFCSQGYFFHRGTNHTRIRQPDSSFEDPLHKGMALFVSVFGCLHLHRCKCFPLLLITYICPGIPILKKSTVIEMIKQCEQGQD